MSWCVNAPNMGNTAKTTGHPPKKRQAQGLSFWQALQGSGGAERLLLFGYGADLGLVDDPLAGKGLQVVQALEQVCAQRGHGVALAAMAKQAGGAQFLDAGVQGVGGDAANAVLQEAKSLRVAVFQGPYHAQCIA